MSAIVLLRERRYVTIQDIKLAHAKAGSDKPETAGSNVAIAAASNVTFAAIRYTRSSFSKTWCGAILILSSRFGVIACHDDAGFGLDDRGRRDLRLVIRTRRQAK